MTKTRIKPTSSSLTRAPTPAKLNHIGFAVSPTTQAQLQKLFLILGLNIEHTETVKDQGVNTHFLPLPLSPTAIELLEPLDRTDPPEPTSTIAQFIKKRGPGIHHISFSLETGTLETTCQALAQAGFKLIYSQPKEGANGMRINFLHPSTAGGVLIELMERAEYTEEYANTFKS